MNVLGKSAITVGPPRRRIGLRILRIGLMPTCKALSRDSFMTVEALVALQGDRLDQIDKDR